MRPRYGPTVNWCDIPVPRLWRCGNRGNVASVLIEKPARGDFLPIIDGGYSLQYTPLMEFREGRGMVLFCQIDVTGRTESDPVAETLARNILQYVSDWKPSPNRTAVYAGDIAGRRHVESAGFVVESYDGAKLSSDQVLVVGPGGARQLAANKSAIADWLKAGGKLLAIGLDQQNVDALLPMKVPFTKAEHISTFFGPNSVNPLLKGVGPADLHNRDPRELSLITSGATLHRQRCARDNDECRRRVLPSHSLGVRGEQTIEPQAHLSASLVHRHTIAFQSRRRQCFANPCAVQHSGGRLEIRTAMARRPLSRSARRMG